MFIIIIYDNLFSFNAEIEKLKFVSEPDQRPTLIKLLSRSREASRQLLIVIDGLDQVNMTSVLFSID